MHCSTPVSLVSRDRRLTSVILEHYLGMGSPSSPPASPTRRFGGAVSDRNPDVHDLRSLQLLELLIAEAAARSLLVLLDMHRLSAGDLNNPLWYDAKVPE